MLMPIIFSIILPKALLRVFLAASLDKKRNVALVLFLTGKEHVLQLTIPLMLRNALVDEVKSRSAAVLKGSSLGKRVVAQHTNVLFGVPCLRGQALGQDLLSIFEAEAPSIEANDLQALSRGEVEAADLHVVVNSQRLLVLTPVRDVDAIKFLANLK
jgi:hypothetical protein